MPARWGSMVAALAATACAGPPVDGPPAGFAVCAAGPDAGATPAAPDYWHDAKPILDRRCATCHTGGGIAPFPLLTYTDAQGSALLVEGAVASGVMPPSPANACCQMYTEEGSLPATERALLLRWLAAGAPEGDPLGAPPSAPASPPSLGRVDMTLRMPEAYAPVAPDGTSEQRCFFVDARPFADETFVTGVDVRPGNAAIVSRVSVEAVPGDDWAVLRTHEGADGRPGFDCADVPERVHRDGVVATWTPGAVPFEAADGRLGIPLAAGAMLMLQIRYDVRADAPAPDQTALDLELADAVVHRAEPLSVTDPKWLAGGLGLGAHDAQAVRRFSIDPTATLTAGQPLFLHRVALHMHELGARGRVAIHRADGSWDCLLDIPAWDARWARDHVFVEPVAVDPGDRVYVECQWKDAAASRLITETCVGLLLYTNAWP